VMQQPAKEACRLLPSGVGEEVHALAASAVHRMLSSNYITRPLGSPKKTAVTVR